MVLVIIIGVSLNRYKDRLSLFINNPKIECRIEYRLEAIVDFSRGDS